MPDLSLSEKRAAAGRKGAAARWGNKLMANVPLLDGKTALHTARQVANLRQGRNDWYRISNNAATGAAEIYIYDEIGYFGITSADFVRDLQGVNSEQITLHINSPGGNVFDGIAILNALKQHPANITVVVDALAASIASVIAQAGDERVMSPNSTMMIHDGMGGGIGLNAADMRELADLLDKTSDNIASVYAERSGQGDAESWRALMVAETWYTADEAVTAGLADRVEGKAAEQTNTWDLSVFHYSGRDQAPAPQIAASATPPAFKFDADAFRRALKEATA